MTNPTTTSPRLGVLIGGDGGLCGLCGKNVTAPLIGVALELGDPVCEDCTDKHARGLWQLTEGLDTILTALTLADPERRPVLISMSLSAIGVLAARCQAVEQPRGTTP